MTAIEEDKGKTCREIADEVHVSSASVHRILTDKMIRKKRPGLLETGVIFPHDSAPVHTANMVAELLRLYNWEILNHPRHSPDSAPCNFYLFFKMKEHLRGQQYESEEDIIVAIKGALRVPEKVTYVAVFESWLRRWPKC